MDLILKTLLILAPAFALFWTIKTKKIFPAIISLGMILGIILVFILPNEIHGYGFYIYIPFVALAFIYGLTAKNKKARARIIICLMSASILLYWLWVFNHYHGNTLLFAIITLIAGLYGIVSKAKLKNELGFLVILAVDAIAIIIEKGMDFH